MKRKQEEEDGDAIANCLDSSAGAVRVKPRNSVGGHGDGIMDRGGGKAAEKMTTVMPGEAQTAVIAGGGGAAGAAIVNGNDDGGGGGGELQSTTDPTRSSTGQDAERTCTHDVVFPEGYVAPPPKPPSKEPAKKYPFTLDPFQREAIKCLEAEESVMVSAHTSAGKTVVAEYAIAMSLRNNQRVVYTSPIKALSNQKYREMCSEFMDVGLMTGDVTISPEASCLVMTTEILRSMLYNGSALLREIAWIIFDEVHYLRDKERGVVWEESIVMAPKNARFVFLSATVPNAREFAEWVAKVHGQPCHIVYTDFRPTPLQHYIFPSGGDGLYLVVDEKGTFREDNFHKAIVAMGANGARKEGERRNGKEQKVAFDEKSDIFKITKMIMQRQYDPVIVFSFSKKDCEALATQMSKLDLNDQDEKKLVEGIFWNAMDILSEDDKKLPQVTTMLPLLRRGIGIHHSGLLPILKEVIEILFQEGLLKMRCWISMYFRREACSAFYLNYTLVLNQLRCEESDPEKLIRQSYRQFQADRGLPALKRKIEEMEEELSNFAIQEEAEVKEYYTLREQERKLKQDIRDVVLAPKNALPFLQPGRIARIYVDHNAVKDAREIPGEESTAWGVIVNFEKNPTKQQKQEDAQDGAMVLASSQQYIVDMVVHCALDGGDSDTRSGRKKIAKPVPHGQKGEPVVVALPLSQIEALSSVRVYIPKDLRPLENREHVSKILREVFQRFPNGLQLLDPEEDMQVDAKVYRKAVRRLEMVEGMLAGHRLSSSPTLRKRLRQVMEKEDLEKRIKLAKRELRSVQTLILNDELKARKRVLRRLGYTNSDDIVQLKGRVACEISSADELVVTELIFNGVFKDLTVDQIVAMISCFVWRERSSSASGRLPRLRDELAVPLNLLRDSARRVGKVAAECKIMKLTEAFEGSLIRAFRRVEEVLGQMAAASKSFGETELQAKFELASAQIKRDIVFAASLYL
ncbi:hypothetical protein CBR_g46718 [Chara braunii]|uniref:Helicase ATP-binding domain-containing protein n=1 Tax=Chara braunii TaxID=69332 RepID=A0A388K3Z4_CHABU|nr:hypothetical protein CBR_g46718 [Chara braunii]|eukprot:GBG64761.1 hypothetical protein CBR_g46718 [Chara braunii]